MAFDEGQAARIRSLLSGEPGVEEKRMFGGLCFLVDGHMACGLVRDELMVRVGPEAYEAALAEPHAREMDFTGRPLRGMVYVAAEGIAGNASLHAWIRRGVAFARRQPPKARSRSRRSRRREPER